MAGEDVSGGDFLCVPRTCSNSRPGWSRPITADQIRGAAFSEEAPPGCTTRREAKGSQCASPHQHAGSWRKLFGAHVDVALAGALVLALLGLEQVGA